MLEKEKRYVELDIKGHWVPLSDEELKEVEEIQGELNIIPCEQCKGVGIWEEPSIIGYGYETAKCKKCEGLGELGYSEELKKELLNNRR